MKEKVAEQAPVEIPFFEVKDGRVFLEGQDVTEIARTEYAEDMEPAANPDNAHVEGEEAEEAAEEVKEPEADKEPKEAEAEKPAEDPKPEAVEEPKTPEKIKFKTKFRGKEEEVEYDQSQLQVRLNKLRAFEENEKEFWDKKKKLDPYMPVVESDWFKQKLAEAYETGELEKPSAPPPVPSLVQYELAKRQADPDHDEVLAELREYAMRLPQDAAMLLDSDPTVFLPEYDRVAAERRARLEKAAVKAEPKVTPEEVKKKLELKEVAKKSAAVSAPGVQAESVSPLKSWEKTERELMKALRDPANANRQLDIGAQLLIHREKKPNG